jgi:hypothetical protein
MKILTNLTASGGLDLGSSNKDAFTIGTLLENNDGNVDNLYVYANADFKNNVILGSSSADTITANAPITASAGITIQNSSLHITGSDSTIYINGQNILQFGGGGNEQDGGEEGSGGGEESPSAINDIYAGNDITTARSGSVVTVSLDRNVTDGYVFLLNSSSYTPQYNDRTIYFSFDPHYNNTTYFPDAAQSAKLKGADYAISDISMSVNLPPAQTHLGMMFTFVNATYVGTSSTDTIGYDDLQGGTITVNGKYSVHKLTFYPYSSGAYTDYIGSGKITGNNNLEIYLITNQVKNFKNIVAHEHETDQHNFITLQAVSSSQYGYTWMIRDINDYQPYLITAV